MNKLKKSRHFAFNTIFQIVAGILVIFHVNRLADLLSILPIIFIIFLIHIFFDDCPNENVITCSILTHTVCLFYFYMKKSNIIFLIIKNYRPKSYVTS